MVIAEGLVTKFHRCPSHEVLWSLVHTDPFYLSHYLPRHLWTWLNLQWGHNSVLVSGIPLQGVSSAHRTKPKVLRAAFKVLRDGWHPVSQHRASVVPDTELASGTPYLWLFLRYMCYQVSRLLPRNSSGSPFWNKCALAGNPCSNTVLCIVSFGSYQRGVWSQTELSSNSQSASSPPCDFAFFNERFCSLTFPSAKRGRGFLQLKGSCQQ